MGIKQATDTQLNKAQRLPFEMYMADMHKYANDEDDMEEDRKMSLKPQMSNTSISVSTLGPSKSVVGVVDEPIEEYNNERILKPTQQILEQLNLQHDNNRFSQKFRDY